MTPVFFSCALVAGLVLPEAWGSILASGVAVVAGGESEGTEWKESSKSPSSVSGRSGAFCVSSRS